MGINLFEVKFFRFWPKTMDYSQGFRLKLTTFSWTVLLPDGRDCEAEMSSNTKL